MNESGFINQESFMVFGKSAIMCKFNDYRGCEKIASLVHSKHHPS
ncbi:MAG: hypothetical protein ACJAT1_000921 [Marivirga sp.]|jgi:hypothetical protein